MLFLELVYIGLFQLKLMRNCCKIWQNDNQFVLACGSK